MTVPIKLFRCQHEVPSLPTFIPPFFGPFSPFFLLNIVASFNILLLILFVVFSFLSATSDDYPFLPSANLFLSTRKIKWSSSPCLFSSSPSLASAMEECGFHETVAQSADQAMLTKIARAIKQKSVCPRMDVLGSVVCQSEEYTLLCAF